MDYNRSNNGYPSGQRRRHESYEIENGVINPSYASDTQNINGFGPYGTKLSNSNQIDGQNRLPESYGMEHGSVSHSFTTAVSHKDDPYGSISDTGSHRETKKIETVVIVGTGDLGRALTVCFVRAGYRVVVGSRNPERHRIKIGAVGGEVVDYSRAMYQSSIILVAIPFEGFESLPKSDLSGRIVVDVTNRPLNYDRKKESLAVQLQNMLPESRVVKAFNTLSAYALQNGNTQGSKEIPICSNDEEAKATIITLARNLGFSPVDFGSLSNAKAVEDIPLAFFPGWEFPGMFALAIFIFSFLLQLFRQQLCTNFDLIHNNNPWDWSFFAILPLTTIHHTLGTTAITILASCYFPGVVASYLQLYRQTKYSKFPKWLDVWLKGRKNLGLLALACVLPHFLLANLTLIGSGGYDINCWRNNLYFFCGVTAFVLMTILGVTSLPSVAQSLTWREFSFIHRYLGWFCLFFATCHLLFMKWNELISNEFICIFIPESGQIFIWYPLITILAKLPLLLPCVDNRLQKIRRGYEGIRVHQKAIEEVLTSNIL